MWRNLRDRFPHPYSLRHAEVWIDLAAAQTPETNFAIASATEAIGGIGLELRRDVHRRSANVGYWLGEPYWGRGIATGALRAFTEFAFAEFNLVRIDANVYEWNPASARVLEEGGIRVRGTAAKEHNQGRADDRPMAVRDSAGLINPSLNHCFDILDTTTRPPRHFSLARTQGASQ